jgi:hypothetical protein
VVRDWIYERPFDETLYTGAYVVTLSKPEAADRAYEVLSLFRRGAIDRNIQVLALTFSK